MKHIPMHKVLRKANDNLRLAKTTLEDHIQAEAIRSCHSLCEAAIEKLPQELRDMITEFLVTDEDVAFFIGKDNKLKIAHGLDNPQHCYDPVYTGSNFHTDILKQLVTGTRCFHFRSRHEFLEMFFDAYICSNEYGHLALNTKVTKLSLAISENCLKNRATLRSNLEYLSIFPARTLLNFIIQTPSTLVIRQLARQLRHLVNIIGPCTLPLHNSGYDVNMVINPEYRSSNVKNNSDSTFSFPVVDKSEAVMKIRGNKFDVWLSHERILSLELD
ncbi:hypothetical protein ACJQWK_01634 [Exserohilum turcicum]